MKKSIALLISIVLLACGNLFAEGLVFEGWVEFKGDLITVQSGSNATDEGKKAKTQNTVFDYGIDMFYTAERFGLVTGISNWSDSGELSDDGSFTEFPNSVSLKETFIWSKFNENFKLYAGHGMESAIRYQPGHNDFFTDQLASGLGSYDYMGNSDYTGSVSGLIGEVSTGNLSAALVYRMPRAGQNADKSTSENGDYKLTTVTRDNMVFQAKYALPETVDIYGGIALKTSRDGAGDNVAQHAFWIAADVLAIENVTLAAQADIMLEANMDGDAKTVLGLNAGYGLVDVADFGTKVTHTMNPEMGLVDAYMTTGLEFTVTPLMVPVVDVTAGAKIDLSTADNAETNADLKLRVGKTIDNVVNRVDIMYNINNDAEVNTFALGYSCNIWF